MSNDYEPIDDSVSFAMFHERTGELNDVDRSRVNLAGLTRQFLKDAFVSTAALVDVDEAAMHIQRAIDVINRNSGLEGSSASQSHFSDRSPFYGIMNPLSMPMTMSQEEHGEFSCVVGVGTFTEPYEGPPGHIHGGYIAAAFDEVLGMTQSLTGRPGMTAGLTIKYRAPTPLHKPIRFRGWVDRVEGRKIFTVGQSFDGDILCAEAEALFLSFPPEMMDRLRRVRDVSTE